MSGFTQVDDENGATNYVYVFVRCDLSFPQRVVQVAHSVIELARNSLIPSDVDHPYVVVLALKNEEQLLNAFRRISGFGIKCKPFYESDLDGQMTAFATAPVSGNSRRYFQKYQCLQGGAV